MTMAYLLFFSFLITQVFSRFVTFQLETTVVQTASHFNLKWSLAEPDIFQPSTTDWIGLFPASLDENDCISAHAKWIHVIGSGQSDSSITLKAPSSPGYYKFLYFTVKPTIMGRSTSFLAINCTTQPENKPYSNIEHIVLIVQENHSFDSYMATYCKAEAYSNPQCNVGPDCCETGPLFDQKSGSAPAKLSDEQNGLYDPDHGYSCEIEEIDGGLMDQFVTGVSCSNKRNFAYADGETASIYHNFAANYAVNDRYFQPIAGATASNNMYLIRGEFMFYDNDCFPDHAIGTQCNTGTYCSFTGLPNLGDMFRTCNITFSSFAGGFGVMNATVQAGETCPPSPSDCPGRSTHYPCTFDASDIPLNYFDGIRDNPEFLKDLDSEFAASVESGTLPQFSYVKPIGYKTEHPGSGTTVTTGSSTVSGIVDLILNSPIYANNTLIFLTWDEGGGYFDHIPTPPNSTVDGKPYGTRVPLFAIGHFAKNNFVSHVQTEHSSVLKFLQWNWFNQSGQLETRDAVVNYPSELLDQSKTGWLPS